jgi:hypothetical protein
LSGAAVFAASLWLPLGADVSVTIFISCVSDEFRDYRDRLKAGLQSHKVRVLVQEDFKGSGFTTVANDDVYIKASDVVVHLVGDMTGWMAQPASNAEILRNHPGIADRCPPLRDVLARGEALSYTQWEAWLALYHGKRLLIAEPAEGAPRGPAFVAAPEQRAAQQAHLDRLRAMDHWPDYTFGSVDQLINHVLSAIFELPEQEAPRPADSPYGGLVAGLLAALLIVAAPVAADHWANTLGVSIAAPLALVLASGGFAVALVYGRYFGLLGASDGPAGSRDRQGYDVLRENLATGGIAVRLYTRWLTAFLDRVDRFFGDAGMANRTLFPHAFGLRTPAPLWTAPAACRSVLPLPPLRGERVGVRGLSTRTNSRVKQRLQTIVCPVDSPPHPSLLPPKRGEKEQAAARGNASLLRRIRFLHTLVR